MVKIKYINDKYIGIAYYIFQSVQLITTFVFVN